jgi:hypothetical protein
LEPLEDADNAGAGQRPVYLNRHTFSSEVIHNVQRSKRSTVGQRVLHEVHRPRLTRAARHRQGYPFAAGEALAPAATHLEPGLAINAVNTLVIRHEAFARNQGMQSSVTEARTLRGMRL